MVDYFVQHPHVATGKFQSLHGKADLTSSWENLVGELNKMGKDGRMKDVKSWKSMWRDNKTMVSQKVAKIRANRAKTRNVGGPPVKLTERDEKILGLMGFDYVEGVECLDSFPEEQSNALELLAEGEEDILNTTGSHLTVRESLAINSNDYADFEMLEDFEVAEPLTSDAILDSERQELPPTASRVEATASSQPGPSGLQVSNRQRETPKVTKPSRETLGTRLQKAHTDFENLAERQISCMEMVAKSIEKIAENDRQRNEILRAFIEAQQARDQTLMDLVLVIKDCVEELKKK